MRIYLLVSFGGDYEDEWENVEGVFSSYAVMATWIKGKFEQLEPEHMTMSHKPVKVGDDCYFHGSFKCLEHNEVVGLRYKAYDVIGEVDCKTDKIVFKES